MTTSKGELVLFLTVAIAVYFFLVVALLSVTSRGKNPWWKLPAMILMFGGFAGNINLVEWLESYLGAKEYRGYDVDTVCMVPMVIGIIAGLITFSILNKITDDKKKLAQSSVEPKPQ